MNKQEENPFELPEEYYYPDQNEAEHFHAELQRELPYGHLLFGVAVKTFAARVGTEDTLFQHINEPDRFTLIHLTWIGTTEINAHFPTVQFDGPFSEFFTKEQRLIAEEQKIIAKQIEIGGC